VNLPACNFISISITDHDVQFIFSTTICGLRRFPE